MSITGIKATPVDKAMLLWTLCLIDHYKNDRFKLSPNGLEQQFGQHFWRVFDAMTEWLARYNLIEIETMRLTPKGELACIRWIQIRDKIFSL